MGPLSEFHGNCGPVISTEAFGRISRESFELVSEFHGNLWANFTGILELVSFTETYGKSTRIRELIMSFSKVHLVDHL